MEDDMKVRVREDLEHVCFTLSRHGSMSMAELIICSSPETFFSRPDNPEGLLEKLELLQSVGAVRISEPKAIAVMREFMAAEKIFQSDAAENDKRGVLFSFAARPGTVVHAARVSLTA